MESSLYEADFYRWTIEQSQFLQLGKFDALDLENLAEEIASLGKQQRQELRNRLGVLIGHLLKWQYQPTRKTRSWQLTIELQRSEIEELLMDNPSLKPYLVEVIPKAFKLGLSLVFMETPLKKRDIPSNCPYTLEQILDENFPDDIDRDFD
ncbi:MAG: DUF29 domain-containing protein [Coleofasciculaceae cyanobacterium SM2_1_6]|nr:DUF29 domain-containing protein [Coleofasciculaceae cyanobacterium SM2_1_6]